MRYVLLSVAAFLLFAVPAFADAAATCVVDINECSWINCPDDWNIEVDDVGDYPGPVTADATATVEYKANFTWDLDAKITTDWGVSQGWTLELDGGSWVTINSTSYVEIVADTAPGNSSLEINARVGSLDWADVDDSCVVTFQISN